MTILYIKTFTNKDDITRFVEHEVAQKMGAWRPRGVVLHNTGSPTLAQFNRGPHGPISDEQRILNSLPDWQRRGFTGCPHGFILPGRFVTANPLWKKGTHSPSYNATFWGLEMAGDFDVEEFPPQTEDYATHVMACLYAMLGHEPDDATFHLHKEDPATTHKHCPGRNAGDKPTWLKRIKERMAFLHPGDLSHENTPPVSISSRAAKVDVAPGDFLFLRQAAGAGTPAVGKLQPGAEVTTLGDFKAAWVNIRSPSGTGWVASRYLKIV